MPAVVDDYAAIASRLRTLGGRTGTSSAMPTRALHPPAAEPGVVPPDPATGRTSHGGTAPQKPQPAAPESDANPDWPYYTNGPKF